MAALPAHAARSLQQVKNGLLVLYGASYFTEEEFIAIDGLIHKGQYIFTSGPQKNLNYSDDITLKIPVNTSSNKVKEETAAVSEAAPPSPISSKHHSDYPEETFTGTSAEASSDDESAPSLNAFTETTQEPSKDPASTPKRKPVAVPAQGGLSAGYTQAQLDAAKALNAQLLAGREKNTTRPKHQKVAKTYPSSTQSGERPVKNASDQSPTPAQNDTHIHSWAEEVNAQEAEVHSPVPRKGSEKSDIPPQAKVLVNEFTKVHGKKPSNIHDLIQPNNPQFRPLDKRPGSRASNTTPKTTKSAGKLAAPKPIVPTGPQKSKLNVPSGKSQLNVASGTVLVAQSSVKKESANQIEVIAGDKIKVFKYVSGITHVGHNLRTQQIGHFPETVFEEVAAQKQMDDLLEQQRTIATQKAQAHSRAPSVVSNGLNSIERTNAAEWESSSVASNDLDEIEVRNAAEWDDVKVVSRPRTRVPAAKKPVLLSGLGTSRYAVLADEADTLSSISDQQKLMTREVREGMSKMFDERAAPILAPKHAATQSIPPGPSHGKSSAKEAFQYPPKTVTCWHWATPDKGCRFTAEECRNLHEYTGTIALSPNGKPTWGAMADESPRTPISPSASTFNPNAAPFQPPITVKPEYAPGKPLKTCWYWANNGNCVNSSETCKYLHGHSAAGIAPRPKHTGWKAIEWSRWPGRDDGAPNPNPKDPNPESESQDENRYELAGEEERKGKLVLEEVKEDFSTGERAPAAVTGWTAGGSNWAESEQQWGNGVVEGNSLNEEALSAWGESGEKSKPPHVKALEEKAQMQAIGW